MYNSQLCISFLIHNFTRLTLTMWPVLIILKKYLKYYAAHWIDNLLLIVIFNVYLTRVTLFCYLQMLKKIDYLFLTVHFNKNLIWQSRQA